MPSADVPPRFRVRFGGDTRTGVGVDDVKAGIAQRFAVGEEVVERMFCGRVIVVKQGIDAPTARRYQQELEGIGAVCWIEPVVQGAEDADDRRSIRRRQLIKRRSRERGSSIQPDRRRAKRRRSDL